MLFKKLKKLFLEHARDIRNIVDNVNKKSYCILEFDGNNVSNILLLSTVLTNEIKKEEQFELLVGSSEAPELYSFTNFLEEIRQTLCNINRTVPFHQKTIQVNRSKKILNFIPFI